LKGKGTAMSALARRCSGFKPGQAET